jgi:hypothetical protein
LLRVFSEGGLAMFGNAYFVAVVMIAFCALSAFAIITTVNHFD